MWLILHVLLVIILLSRRLEILSRCHARRHKLLVCADAGLIAGPQNLPESYCDPRHSISTSKTKQKTKMKNKSKRTPPDAVMGQPEAHLFVFPKRRFETVAMHFGIGVS
jgi:hypothetical protein